MGAVIANKKRIKIPGHLDEHGLLGESQHGFSCVLSKENLVDIEVSNKVPHYRIFKKLHSHRTTGEIFISCIKDWKQNGHLLGQRGVSSMIPQGMMLDLVFLKIFLNGMRKRVKTEISSSAGDIKLFWLTNCCLTCQETHKAE